MARTLGLTGIIGNRVIVAINLLLLHCILLLLLLIYLSLFLNFLLFDKFLVILFLQIYLLLLGLGISFRGLDIAHEVVESRI